MKTLVIALFSSRQERIGVWTEGGEGCRTIWTEQRTQVGEAREYRVIEHR